MSSFRCAGIDWAKDKHDVLVQEPDGTEVVASTFAHDERGIEQLCRTLVRLAVGLVAIERPDGLLIERLLEAGIRVMAIPTRSPPRVRDSGPRAVSPTGSTRSCSASSPAPTATGSGC